MQTLLIAVLGTLALAGPTGYWMGYGMASGSYEKRLAAISLAVSESQNAAIDRANRQAKAAAELAIHGERRRAKQRALSTEVNREVVQDTDLSCEWRDAHRLRLEALYATYGYPTGNSKGVSSTVPGSPEDDATP